MHAKKVACITGVSRGIGHGCALEMARRGFDLVLTARTVTGAEPHERSSTLKTSATAPLSGSLERTAAEVRALAASAPGWRWRRTRCCSAAGTFTARASMPSTGPCDSSEARA